MTNWPALCATDYLAIPAHWRDIATTTDNVNTSVVVVMHPSPSRVDLWCISVCTNVQPITCVLLLQQWFKSKGKLTKHAKKHLGILWKCNNPKCTYSHNDKRNLKVHVKKHSDILPYCCDNCKERFKYDTQYKCHINNKKCSTKRSDSLDY